MEKVVCCTVVVKKSYHMYMDVPDNATPEEIKKYAVQEITRSGGACLVGNKLEITPSDIMSIDEPYNVFDEEDECYA